MNEFFRLWTVSAEHAPTWVKIYGFTPGQSAALSRALVRDLALRLCYLETCERTLGQEYFSESELALLEQGTLPRVYRRLIEAQRRRGLTQVGLGLKLGIEARRLREFQSGVAAPSLAQITTLCRSGENRRLAACIGFFDSLLRQLDLKDSGLAREVLQAARVLLPNHRATLDTFTGWILHRRKDGSIRRETRDFAGFLAYGQHLLVQPGFEELIQRKTMRTELWRCHLYALRFARMFDLAQAYFQFSVADDDQPLIAMLRAAEIEPSGYPERWMKKLQENNQVLAFPDAKSPSAQVAHLGLDRILPP